MPHLSRESPLFVQVLFQCIVRSIMVRWKTLSAECGKCRLWKIWSVESAECRKFQFSISISGEMRRNSVLTIKKEKEKSLHFKMRRAGMVISVVVCENESKYIFVEWKFILSQENIFLSHENVIYGVKIYCIEFCFFSATIIIILSVKLWKNHHPTIVPCIPQKYYFHSWPRLQWVPCCHNWRGI